MVVPPPGGPRCGGPEDWLRRPPPGSENRRFSGATCGKLQGMPWTSMNSYFMEENVFYILSIYLSVYLSIDRSIYLSVYICLYIYIHISLFVGSKNWYDIHVITSRLHFFAAVFTRILQVMDEILHACAGNSVVAIQKGALNGSLAAFKLQEPHNKPWIDLVKPWENMGKPWENGGLMGSNGIYPLVIWHSYRKSPFG